MLRWKIPLLLAVGACCGSTAGCDKQAPSVEAPEAAAPPAVPLPASAPPEPPHPPEIIVDQATIAVGQERIATGELNLDERLLGILKAAPMIAGHPVDFVAMRNAKPSQVAAVATALRRANAASAEVRTEARDGSTGKLPLSFTAKVVDCAAAAWITKDGAIDVWSAGGGAPARRVNKGLAGPDMTLGTEAVQRVAAACTAPELVLGGDDHFPWGLVFDLATGAMQSRSGRPSAAVLSTSVVPGRKVRLQ